MSWRGQDKDRQTQARGNTIRPRFTAALTASSVRKDRKSRESGIRSRTAGRGQVRLPRGAGAGLPLATSRQRRGRQIPARVSSLGTVTMRAFRLGRSNWPATFSFP